MYIIIILFMDIFWGETVGPDKRSLGFADFIHREWCGCLIRYFWYGKRQLLGASIGPDQLYAGLKIAESFFCGCALMGLDWTGW